MNPIYYMGQSDKLINNKNVVIDGKSTINRNIQLQFQKNYPKNVFIPIIQYLADKGYKRAYQDCVGTRQQIERKNVVSLDMIYTLTRQSFFQRNINRELLLQNVSNKILMNSKIKKKLFHLLIAQYILLQDYQNQFISKNYNGNFNNNICLNNNNNVANLKQYQSNLLNSLSHSSSIKQFKKNISKKANQISLQYQNILTDELFTYSNSIIYLLTMFLRIFKNSLQWKGIDKIDEQFDNLKIEQDNPQSLTSNIRLKNNSNPQSVTSNIKLKNGGSKQQYKYLVKEIVQLLSKRNIPIDKLADAFQLIKNTIIFKCNHIREQYHLIDKIPNWQDFISIVVMRCFQTRRKDVKITNMLLNQWINQYKAKTLSVQPQITQDNLKKIKLNIIQQNRQPDEIKEKHNPFGNIEQNIIQQNRQPDEIKGFKTFSPIIIKQNYNL